jgi:hypothetical protein
VVVERSSVSSGLMKSMWKPAKRMGELLTSSSRAAAVENTMRAEP